MAENYHKVINIEKVFMGHACPCLVFAILRCSGITHIYIKGRKLINTATQILARGRLLKKSYHYCLPHIVLV